MKKLLAVALAVVMMLSVSVMAFAVDQTVSGPVEPNEAQTVQADVVTKTEDLSGQSAEEYIITVPSEVSVAWGDTAAQDANYQVYSRLKIGASLKVSAAPTNGDNTMTATGTQATLSFAVENGEAQTFAEVNGTLSAGVKTGVDAPNAVTVTVSGFDSAPVGAYTGHMTYTAEYVPAA